MLSSLLGIRLILWMGKTIPSPAPMEVLNSLSSVEVKNDSENGDGFKITFTLSKDKTGDFGLLNNGALDPFNRVIIGVLMGVTPEVLIDGIITHHQIEPGDESGISTLTVMGTDISIMLDLEEQNDKFENQPDFVIATRLLSKYANLGIVPNPTPTSDIPIMLQRIPRQCGTDSRFLQRMAERNGFVFYIEPVTFGVSKAYWGPENRLGMPQPALSINLGEFTNVKSLRFSNNTLSGIESDGSFIEPMTWMSLPIPRLPSLKIPPLARTPVETRRRSIERNSANRNPAQAATSVMAAATNAPDPINGEGELDAVKYGHVLRARRLVAVRGAGLSYNGNYIVKSVTHKIKKGEYTQSFSLSRDGIGTILPVVMQ
jgi:hypothetical protein